MPDGVQLGQEWLVDASGCDVDRLRDVRALAGLFEEVVVALQLSVVGAPQWHQFPWPGGVTGLALLSESHLAIHTFPEHAWAALSVYSCRTRADDAGLEARVGKALGARHVALRTHARTVRAP